MKEAARNMLRRDPLISLTALRFFKLAGVNPDQFLAGLSGRGDTVRIDLQASKDNASQIARLVAGFDHGGACGLSYAIRPNALYLHSIARDFIFMECHCLVPAFEGTHHALLTLHRRSIPHTILAALVGRPLPDLIEGDRRRFFLSRHTRILDAALVPENRGTAVELVLGDKWLPLSRFLKLL